MTHHPVSQNEFKEYPVVYLKSEGVFAIIISYGAFFSMVKYYKDGISYETIVENTQL